MITDRDLAYLDYLEWFQGKVVDVAQAYLETYLKVKQHTEDAMALHYLELMSEEAT